MSAIGRVQLRCDGNNQRTRIVIGALLRRPDDNGLAVTRRHGGLNLDLDDGWNIFPLRTHKARPFQVDGR